MRLARLVVAGGLMLAAPGAFAGATDPADLAFWQAVQNSTNPAEYKAYLESFPNGRFAALARLRMANPPTAAEVAPAAAPAAATAAPPPAAAPAPTGAPQPAAAAVAAPPRDLGPVAGNGRVKLLAKPVYPLGEPIKIRFASLPRGDNHTVRIIPADTPNAFQQPIQRIYIYTTNRDGGAADSQTGQVDVQPLAPGDYQAVVVTTIFNNANREEIVARAGFTVD